MASGLNLDNESSGNLYFLKNKSSPVVNISPLFVVKANLCFGSVRQAYISMPLIYVGGFELRGHGLGGGELTKMTPKPILTIKCSYFALIEDFCDLCQVIESGVYGILQ